jgi:hypothetical protein
VETPRQGYMFEMKETLGEKDTPKYGEAKVELMDSLEVVVNPKTQGQSKLVISPAECGESFGQLRQNSQRNLKAPDLEAFCFNGIQPIMIAEESP